MRIPRPLSLAALAASGVAAAVVLVVPVLSARGGAGAAGGPNDQLTFHADNLRSGWYQHETKLTPANVGNRQAFGALAPLRVGGKVYAQPLFVTGETVKDGTTHDLVIVATAKDEIFAFDAATNALVWHTDFKTGGQRQQLAQWISCGDVNPDIGIVGTPVADRTTDQLYVVVPTEDAASK